MFTDGWPVRLIIAIVVCLAVLALVPLVFALFKIVLVPALHGIIQIVVLLAGFLFVARGRV